MNPEVFGRLRVIKELSSDIQGLSLNVGCKETRFGNINLDIDPNINPDIVGDVLNLPFSDNTFDCIYFNDVLEHLPKNTELKALSEIYRVLKPNGMLVLTTPNDRFIYTYLDPAKYVLGHRHYKVKNLSKILNISGFKVEVVFTAGGFWELFGVLWYSFITYPITKIFKVNLPYAPKLLLKKIDIEYNLRKKDSGYTIFIIAKK